MCPINQYNKNNSKDRTFNMVRILAKQKKGLNVIHINAQSLVNKMDECRYLFENSNVHVICVSESWLDKNMPDKMFEIAGYNIFRMDREKRSGGVVIYVMNNFKCNVVNKSSVQSPIEYIFLEVLVGENKVLIGNVYRNNNTVDFFPLINEIKSISIKYEKIIISGDFNNNILKENIFKNEMISIGLHLVNSTQPTHFTKTNSTLLDLFFIDDIRNAILYDQLSCPNFSKHDLIFLTYDIEFKILPTTYTYRDFRNINYFLLKNEIEIIDWSGIIKTQSACDQVEILERNIEYLFNKYVPEKTKTVIDSKRPWFNKKIEYMIVKRNKAYNQWKIFKTTYLYTIFQQLRRNVNNEIKNTKSNYYQNKLNHTKNSKTTWKTIKEVGIGDKKKTISSEINLNELNNQFVNIPVIDSNNLDFNSNYLNTYTPPLAYTNSNKIDFNSNYSSNYTPYINKFKFSFVRDVDVLECCIKIKSNAIGCDNINPKFLKALLPYLLPHITYIFNTIIKYSDFPKNWKRAKIIPIPKNQNEYRPIALLPFVSKVFEMLIFRQLERHFQRNKLLTERQSGYRQNRSTITALIDITEYLREATDKGNISFLTLLDHSKAFDSVDHHILCEKLYRWYNISESATSLIYSYLSNRYQAVYLNNTCSSFLPVSKGVPQGSVLGPFLFSVYVNDLPNVLKFCRVQMYADDVQLCISSSLSNVNMCVENLNSDLNNVFEWATCNRLCLNPNKSKCIIIFKNNKIDISLFPKIKMKNFNIEIVQSIKNLGIIFNTTLTWKTHIYSIIGKTYGILRTLWTTHNLLPFKFRMLIAKSYLIPVLLYGSEIFSSCDAESKRKLNVLYNDIARYIFKLRRHDHISQYSKQIFQCTFDQLLQHRRLSLLHKIIYYNEPFYLYDRIKFFKSSRTKHIHQIKHYHKLSEFQFFVNTICLWNSLPIHLQFINSNAQFKKELFKHYIKENN